MDELRDFLVSHYSGSLPDPEQAEQFREGLTGMFADWDSRTVGRLITNLIMMMCARGREDGYEAGRALMAAAIALEHFRDEARPQN